MKPNIRLIVLLLLGGAVLFIATSTQRPAVRAEALRPVHQVNLSPLGQGVEPGVLPLLQFSGNTTLVVAFVVGNHTAGLPKLLRRGAMTMQSRFLLQVAVIDAKTGVVLRRTEWPANRLRHSGLVFAQGSRLVLLMGDRIALCNDNLELTKQLGLPHASEWGWRAYASFSGQNILFVSVSRRKQERCTWVWVDACHFRVVREWSMSPFESRGVSISDSRVVFEDTSPRPRAVRTRKLLMQPLEGGTAQPVLRARYSSIHYLYPRFVTANLLFFTTGDGMSVLDLLGSRTIFRRVEAPRGPIFGLAAPAKHAARFVVPLLDRDALGMRLDYIDIFDGHYPAHPREVKVVGGPPLAWPAWFASAPWPTWLALSPDGRLLAVMENFKTLLLFSLPRVEYR